MPINGTINDALAALSLDTEKPKRMPLLHFQTRLPLRDPDGNEGWIDVYSSDSEIARRHQREIQRRRFNLTRGRGNITPEEVEAEGTDLLVALTADWHLLGKNGEPLGIPFSPQNARTIYDKVTWVREQVDQFAADRGNFTPDSPSR